VGHVPNQDANWSGMKEHHTYVHIPS
jgi:hypothetical protein